VIDVDRGGTRVRQSGATNEEREVEEVARDPIGEAEFIMERIERRWPLTGPSRSKYS